MHSSLFQPFVTDAPILVVGDDQKVNQQLRHALTQAGYAVVTAADEAEALAQYEKQAIDLVLLSVMQSEAKGLALCQKLRRRSAVPIALLASPDQADAIVGCLDAGADDAIIYPFTSEELTARVAALLRRLQWMAAGARPFAPLYLQTQTVPHQAGQTYVEGLSSLWGRLAPAFDTAD